MTVKRQRSRTAPPRHRDQSQPGRSREQQLQPHASGGRRRAVQVRRVTLPVSGLPSSTTDPFLRAHSAKRHWSSPNPQINLILIDKLDKKKKKSLEEVMGYLWTILKRQRCLFGQGKKDHVPPSCVHLKFRMLRKL